MPYKDNKNVLYEKQTSLVFWAIRGIEILLAGFLVLLVIASAIYFLGSLIQDYSQLANYSNFQQLLSYLLLLIIALELAHMLIEHKSDSVVEVMIYAIARKMLIFTTTANELLISVVTLAILFAVRKYLIHGKKSLFGANIRLRKHSPKAKSEDKE